MHIAMKITTSFLVLASLALSLCGFLSAQNKPDSASSKILASENKWNAAYKRGDMATMQSLLAEDFIITLEDGSTLSKPDTLRTTETALST
jgi:hypothetical protein